MKCGFWYESNSAYMKTTVIVEYTRATNPAFLCSKSEVNWLKN